MNHMDAIIKWFYSLPPNVAVGVGVALIVLAACAAAYFSSDPLERRDGLRMLKFFLRAFWPIVAVAAVCGAALYYILHHKS